MSDRTPELQASTISEAEYKSAMVTRADANLVITRWMMANLEVNVDPDTELDFRRLRFPRHKMISPGGSEDEHAVADIVQVVAVEPLIEGDESGPALVTVRQVLGSHALSDRSDRFTLSADGMILNRNPNTPNTDIGYLVAVARIDDDELGFVQTREAMPLPLKRLSVAPPPKEQDRHFDD